jgi:mannose-6-phosphate isomerase-like protein (cupin superfamily)
MIRAWHNAVHSGFGLALTQIPDLGQQTSGGTVEFALHSGTRGAASRCATVGAAQSFHPHRHTDGMMALGEVTLPPRTPGPHLHVHSTEDEMFFVLDGVLTVQIAEELHDIAAGGLAWGARERHTPSRTAAKSQPAS